MYGNNLADVGFPSVNNDSRRGGSFLGELIHSIALITVVLNTAATKAQANNSYFGMAIGFVVLAGAIVVGSVDGACFNPAVSVLTLMHGDADDLWVFLLGPAIGGIIGGFFYMLTNPAGNITSNTVRQQSYRLTFLCEIEFPKSEYIQAIARGGYVAKYTMEFIGTFFLTWVVALTVNNTRNTGNYLAIGSILASMVYAGGSISGGHYNPAVTLGVFFRGMYRKPYMLSVFDCFVYMVVQLVAAFVAGGFASAVNGGTDLIACPQVNPEHTKATAVVAEFVFTTMLLMTVLCVATSSKVTGNSYFGIAIGWAVLAGGIAVNDISGGVFNPAIAIALPAINKTCTTQDVWVYLLGDFLGSGMGAALFLLWHFDSDSNQKAEFLEEQPDGVPKGQEEERELELMGGVTNSSTL